MLFLRQEQTNTVYLTLTESLTITATPVYYLFRFMSDTTNDETLFVAEDLSTNISRFNKFNITLTAGTTNLTAGTISIANGAGKYEVYEQYTQTNLDLTGTTGVVIERGMIQVSGSSNSYITQSYSGNPTTYNFYEPN